MLKITHTKKKQKQKQSHNHCLQFLNIDRLSLHVYIPARKVANCQRYFFKLQVYAQGTVSARTAGALSLYQFI